MTSSEKGLPGQVTVHALSAGHFTLPEWQFIHPVSKDARKTVPSLAFLIQHQDQETKKMTRIVFDLGVRRNVERYMEAIQKHIETRQPMTTLPDVTASLAKGGLAPNDIDFVIYSHVHWDHIGEPRDFPQSMFVVGHGSRALLNGTSWFRGGHSFFESDLLPEDRNIELSDPNEAHAQSSNDTRGVDFNRPWQACGALSKTLDIFGDGSLLIVHAPGHLPGHLNLLARTENGDKIYMAGDACHDRRLLTGEKAIGEFPDAQGHMCCIHADRKQAEETIEMIRGQEKEGVEIIFAHDVEWESNPKNKSRFFGSEG